MEVLSDLDKANVLAIVRDRIGMEARILELEGQVLEKREAALALNREAEGLMTEIRDLRGQAALISNAELARKYECSPNVIYNLAHGRKA